MKGITERNKKKKKTGNKNINNPSHPPPTVVYKINKNRTTHSIDRQKGGSRQIIEK